MPSTPLGTSTTPCRTATAPDDGSGPAPRSGPPPELGAVLLRRPDVLLTPRASSSPKPMPCTSVLPGTTACLRRPVAPGRMGAGRSWSADGRVLALAHATLRYRNLLGRVLPHAGHPGRTYDELPARSVTSSGARDRWWRDVDPDAEVAFLYSLPNRWLMQRIPALAAAEGGPDARAYDGIFAPSTAALSTPDSRPGSCIPGRRPPPIRPSSPPVIRSSSCPATT